MRAGIPQYLYVGCRGGLGGQAGIVEARATVPALARGDLNLLGTIGEALACSTVEGVWPSRSPPRSDT